MFLPEVLYINSFYQWLPEVNLWYIEMRTLLKVNKLNLSMLYILFFTHWIKRILSHPQDIQDFQRIDSVSCQCGFN